MRRIFWPVFSAIALLGVSGAAVAAPDDVATTVAKAQKTLADIDKTIDGIDARKGMAPRAAMAARPGGTAAPQRVSSAANANRARANANRANANTANRSANRNNRPNRPNPNPNAPKKP